MALPAHAATFTRNLDFTASDQSIWGPGAGTVLASPGATSLGLSFQGGLGISIPEICVPGVGCIPAIDLPGASFTSDLGAHATLSAGPAGVGPDFTLGIDALNPAQLGQVVSGSSSATVAQVPAVDIVLASAGASLGVTQSDSFTASALTGDLFYSRQGSGVVDSIPVALARKEPRGRSCSGARCGRSSSLGR